MPDRPMRILTPYGKAAGPPPQTAAPVSIAVEIPPEIVLEIDVPLSRRVHQLATAKIAKGLPLNETEAQILADSVLNHREVMRWLVGSMSRGNIPVTLNFPWGIV